MDDLEPFLNALFSDGDIIQLGFLSRWQPRIARAIARRRAPKMAVKYNEIGGGSPIDRHTAAQARALREELARRNAPARVEYVFRYTQPRAAQVLPDVAGHDVIVPLTLYPHYSGSTTGSSLRDLETAMRQASIAARVQPVLRWGNHPSYVRLLREQLATALATVQNQTRDPVHLVLSAHGIPQSYHKRGDPYRREVEETFNLVTRDLEGYASMTLAFQSKVGPVAWLKPYTDDVIAQLGADGARAIVTVPLGFVSDHIETLHDLDINYRAQAHRAGITTYHRVPAFNDDPRFARVLADVLADAGALKPLAEAA